MDKGGLTVSELGIETSAPTPVVSLGEVVGLTVVECSDNQLTAAPSSAGLEPPGRYGYHYRKEGKKHLDKLWRVEDN